MKLLMPPVFLYHLKRVEGSCGSIDDVVVAELKSRYSNITERRWSDMCDMVIDTVAHRPRVKHFRDAQKELSPRAEYTPEEEPMTREDSDSWILGAIQEYSCQAARAVIETADLHGIRFSEPVARALVERAGDPQYDNPDFDVSVFAKLEKAIKV